MNTGVFLLLAGAALGQQEVVVGQAAPAMPALPIMTSYTVRDSEPVKGFPYMAESVTEHTQTLADGNKITHQNKSLFARDGEGRTRREFELGGFGPIGKAEAPIKSIVIEDVVTRTHYTIDTERKQASRHKMDGNVMFKILDGAKTISSTIARDNVVMERRPGTITTATLTRSNSRIQIRSNANAKQEDLGTRNMEGVIARGTRSTMTIPAGEVGNERPIDIVTETWFSDEIKAVVFTRHSDPRTGEIVTRLQNIRTGEPDRSLFEVPAGYKVEDIADITPGFTETKVIRLKEDN
jgi:hypothetical protein